MPILQMYHRKIAKTVQTIYIYIKLKLHLSCRTAGKSSVMLSFPQCYEAQGAHCIRASRNQDQCHQKAAAHPRAHTH